ncbi:MAG: deoxyguanosinetriphosphate triphosphohydrolase [Syntrophomonadaceae bacterium]|nr:deoxyguanosinetriphosphate triphosphohydrolase [Syntrophomonadaceae bacterium]
MRRVREDIEAREAETLAAVAVLSRETRGRREPEEPCPVRTAFQRDRDRIIHSKAFRRLKHKTQVFIAPEGDHYRTRLTHTLEVAQIARTVARALRLNEDLTEAIALGHDLGHTPFGHAGEGALNEVYPPGFRHNEQSLRTVDELEVTDFRRGLNLTWEVRDGILRHTGPELPCTLEGRIVSICDRIAYINHDIDDALRAGIIRKSDLPRECLEILGDNHRARINTLVLDLIENSMNRPDITMSPRIHKAMDDLRSYLFRYVYVGSAAKREEEKVRGIVKQLYQYLLQWPEEIPEDFRCGLESSGRERTVVDYIAGMTDRYAIKVYEKFFLPLPWLQKI